MTDEKQSRFTMIPNEFIKMKLSGNSTKVYLYLLSGVNEKENGHNGVWPSWDTLKEETGIKSNQTLSNAITELVEFGWIEDIGTRNNNSNIYYMARSASPNQDLITKRNAQKFSRSNFMKTVSKGKPAPKKGEKYNWKRVENE